MPKSASSESAHCCRFIEKKDCCESLEKCLLCTGLKQLRVETKVIYIGGKADMLNCFFCTKCHILHPKLFNFYIFSCLLRISPLIFRWVLLLIPLAFILHCSTLIDHKSMYNRCRESLTSSNWRAENHGSRKNLSGSYS